MSPLVEPASGLVRVRLELAYDGTAYAGWARQPRLRTVQGTLEQALATVARVPVRVSVAGRTDAGVHASGQIATADLARADWERIGPSLSTRLAGVLPRDVRVMTVMEALPGFDVRFSALSRCYRYRIADAAWGVDPLRRHDTWALGRRLELTALQQASGRLLGTRDFAAYCRRREGASTIRKLLRLDWHRDDEGVLVATVEADAFCHSMVRSLIGALVLVGAGRRPVDWPAELLAGRVRDGAVTVAPARGLTLLAVRYPPAQELAERARVTRTVRWNAEEPR